MSEEKMTPEDAVKLLNADREERAQAVLKIMQAAFEEYRCEIHCLVEVGPGGVALTGYKVIAL